MAGSLEFIKSASGTSGSSLSVTDCFSADYDVYAFFIVKQDTTADGDTHLRFIDSGGSVITASEYDTAQLSLGSYGTFGQGRATHADRIYNVHQGQAVSAENGGSINYIYNPNDSSTYTFHQTSSAGAVNSSGLVGNKGIGVHKVAEQITGFNLFPNSGSYDFLEVNVYGLASN